MSPILTVRLAGLTITIEGLDFGPVPDFYLPFVTKIFNRHNQQSHNAFPKREIITLKIQKKLPAFKNNRLVLGCETWGVSATSDGWLFTFHPEPKTQKPAQVVSIDRRFREGKLYLNPKRSGAGSILGPFMYPMLEVLFVPILAERQGILCHACGVVDSGQGYVFLGNSGAGKSTIARLWQRDATVLSDDRIIVRRHGKEFWAYGTPWHGDLDCVTALGVPLRAVFFLKHGSENRARPLGRTAALTALLSRLFLPLWNRASMRRIIDFGDRLTAAVPCYELAFVPDRSIVEYVKTLPKDQ